MSDKCVCKTDPVTLGLLNTFFAAFVMQVSKLSASTSGFLLVCLFSISWTSAHSPSYPVYGHYDSGNH